MHRAYRDIDNLARLATLLGAEAETKQLALHTIVHMAVLNKDYDTGISAVFISFCIVLLSVTNA